MSDMTDEQFLRYVETHSETDRALFHRSMVSRFLTLAGENLDDYKADLGPNFIAMHKDAIRTLLANAWEALAVELRSRNLAKEAESSERPAPSSNPESLGCPR